MKISDIIIEYNLKAKKDKIMKCLFFYLKYILNFFIL